MLFWLGYRSTKIDLISLFLRSNLLKYLPGGIWHFVERIRVLKIYIGSGNAIASVLLEPLLMLAAALLWVPLGGLQSGMAILCTIPELMLFKRFREPLIRRLENLKASQLEEIYYEARMIDRSDSFTIERDVAPGEAVYIDVKNNLFTKLCSEPGVHTPCIFEHVYFARADSLMDGISIYKTRIRQGAALAKKIIKLQKQQRINKAPVCCSKTL